MVPVNILLLTCLCYMKHIFVILYIFLSGLMDIPQLDELFSLVLAGCRV